MMVSVLASKTVGQTECATVRTACFEAEQLHCRATVHDAHGMLCCDCCMLMRLCGAHVCPVP